MKKYKLKGKLYILACYCIYCNKQTRVIRDFIIGRDFIVCKECKHVYFNYRQKGKRLEKMLKEHENYYKDKQKGGL